MSQTPFKQQWWHPIIKSLAAKRPVVWIISRTLHHLDNIVMRFSQGKYSAANILTGLPVLTLTTTGAKSSKKRSTPVIAIPDGEKLVIIASNWGQKRHPGWYYNIRANPQVAIAYADRKTNYRAQEVVGAEREMYWQKAVAVYPGYAAYQQRAQGRTIPVIICTPQPKSPTAGNGHDHRL